jgi:hypothetical protein
MAGRRRSYLNLSAPREITFVIAFIVALVAFLIAAKVIGNPLDTVAVVWIALVAYAILAIGNLVRGI